MNKTLFLLKSIYIVALLAVNCPVQAIPVATPEAPNPPPPVPPVFTPVTPIPVVSGDYCRGKETGRITSYINQAGDERFIK